jgi:hypothetical protein
LSLFATRREIKIGKHVLKVPKQLETFAYIVYRVNRPAFRPGCEIVVVVVVIRGAHAVKMVRFSSQRRIQTRENTHAKARLSGKR